jgi:serine/threonine protein kinase
MTKISTCNLLINYYILLSLTYLYKKSKVIKILKNQHKDDQKLKRECNLLCKLNHENIIKYYDHFELITKESNSHICIITDYYKVYLNINYWLKYEAIIDFENLEWRSGY